MSRRDLPRAFLSKVGKADGTLRAPTSLPLLPSPTKRGRVGRGWARHEERASTHPIPRGGTRVHKARGRTYFGRNACISSKLLPQPHLGGTPDQLAAESNRSPDVGRVAVVEIQVQLRIDLPSDEALVGWCD